MWLSTRCIRRRSRDFCMCFPSGVEFGILCAIAVEVVIVVCFVFLSHVEVVSVHVFRFSSGVEFVFCILCIRRRIRFFCMFLFSRAQGGDPEARCVGCRQFLVCCWPPFERASY
jgi:hypothetical protein